LETIYDVDYFKRNSRRYVRKIAPRKFESLEIGDDNFTLYSISDFYLKLCRKDILLYHEEIDLKVNLTRFKIILDDMFDSNETALIHISKKILISIDGSFNKRCSRSGCNNVVGNVKNIKIIKRFCSEHRSNLGIEVYNVSGVKYYAAPHVMNYMPMFRPRKYIRYSY
ncbi:unnamed protein product, partial [marine sediment metagenome]